MRHVPRPNMSAVFGQNNTVSKVPNRSNYSVPGITVFGGIFLSAVATESSSSRDFDELRAGPAAYRIPSKYRADGDTSNDVFVQVNLADWGPLERDKPGSPAFRPRHRAEPDIFDNLLRS
ncbi:MULTISPECIES: hypothetical protein [Rhizobium/Agrobacterium group]|uniref:Uncharacterized protein n=6 Tax=Agrobacterium TaxID=357 RepID=Q7D2Q2_AGRFC|nr:MULTISPECIES: hypothetical protein [Rhizobium/Agrobacterium group]ASK45219.1 hypothetical protein [Agrobacterium radiobacter]AAC82639.1 unknown [Agrobacterium fabrum str. C58]AAK90988.1 ORF13 hypothetical protein [Agrobacterium fabrum str. C58]ASK42208.1 hypothetical protein [Agrobacterium sp.]ASK42562.1 hypothetical protein [Agrobacterium fabrum str. C58]